MSTRLFSAKMCTAKQNFSEKLPRHVLNIRCSIVGPSPMRGRGLIEWFVRQPSGATVKGFEDHLWCGVTTRQYAELCADLLHDETFGAARNEGAVLHFAPNKRISKYELLVMCQQIFRPDVVVQNTVSPSGPMRRILVSNRKYTGNWASEQRSIRPALEALVSDMPR